MKKLFLLICILSFGALNAQISNFNEILQKNVDKSGIVDYKSIKSNETKLDDFLSYLNETSVFKG